MSKTFKNLLLVMWTFSVGFAQAEQQEMAITELTGEDAKLPYYFPMEPDLVTNYATLGSKLSYVRVSVSIMVSTSDDVLVIEHHEPLLRAAFIDILGAQPEHKIKSTAGREAIRKECLKMANSLIETETGYSIIEDVLFTKYIYN